MVLLLFQDALVHLGGVISFAEFQEAVARAIAIVVRNSVCEIIFIFFLSISAANFAALKNWKMEMEGFSFFFSNKEQW